MKDIRFIPNKLKGYLGKIIGTCINFINFQTVFLEKMMKRLTQNEKDNFMVLLDRTLPHVADWNEIVLPCLTILTIEDTKSEDEFEESTKDAIKELKSFPTIWKTKICGESRQILHQFFWNTDPQILLQVASITGVKGEEQETGIGDDEKFGGKKQSRRRNRVRRRKLTRTNRRRNKRLSFFRK